jgi:hypothetical protein
VLIVLALVTLGAWLLGLFQFYRFGDIVHVLLLVGLMLLLLGGLKARDAALRRNKEDRRPDRH